MKGKSGFKFALNAERKLEGGLEEEGEGKEFDGVVMQCVSIYLARLVIEQVRADGDKISGIFHKRKRESRAKLIFSSCLCVC